MRICGEKINRSPRGSSRHSKVYSGLTGSAWHDQRAAVRRVLRNPPVKPRLTAGSMQKAPGFLQRRVGSVACRNPTGRVRDIVGDDPLATVQDADTRAIRFLDSAIAALEHGQSQIRGGEPAAWPTISDTVAVSLRNRFGIDPTDPEIWTSQRRLTRSGSPTVSLLLIRLHRTRAVLAGGRIHYRCLDWPPCPPMSRPGEVVLGALAWGEAGGDRIYLCEGFWRPTTTDDQRGLVLAHEAFHVYFEGIDTGRNMWNAHCIEQFLADVNDVPIGEDFEGACG